MRFLTDCVTCGSVVVQAETMVLVLRDGDAGEALFDCPVCEHRRTVAVAPGARSALVARGAAVVAYRSTPDDGPLTTAHLAELQRLLADDDSCRRLIDGAA